MSWLSTETTRIRREFIDLRPMGGNTMIMADPPWNFSNWSKAGEGKNPSAHYDCQPLDWIKALPIEALASKNAVLWLWATNPMLPQALEVMAAWGFTFKTAGTWVKRTTTNQLDAFGTGYILRSSNEPFLIGTIGKPKTSRGVRSTVASYTRDNQGIETWPAPIITIEAALGGHSEKPKEAFKAAEKLCGDCHRIEVFSRTNRQGWSAWGDEAGILDAVA